MSNNLPTEKKAAVVSMLCEGNSIRGIERVTGIHRDTVMRLGVRMGEGCAKIMDERFRALDCKVIQLDETWGFVGMKQKTANMQGAGSEVGSVWTWVAIDAETKLVPTFHIGDRTQADADLFLEDLASRLSHRVQISSDALRAYQGAIERAFGSEVDYGSVVKIYSATQLDEQRRYSQPEVVRVDKSPVLGEPIADLISTSYVEKQNHTLRMHCRRMSRLTNAFSKKMENFKAAVALHYAYYNFCKMHKSIRCTPAMAAGVVSSQWTVSNLVEIRMSERIERIEKAVGTMYPNCMILHAESVPVVEKFNGQTVWEGVVETFSIEGDMAEKRVFAWEIPGPKPDYVTVLDRPPINSARDAVRAYVASLGRK